MEYFDRSKSFFRNLCSRNNSPDWRVTFNYASPNKSFITHLGTGKRNCKKTYFIRDDFDYKGFHSIFFIDRNYGCCLVKHSQEDIRWEPGDPGDDIMLLQLDSGMYQIIKSSQIELMAKRFLNEDWSILGDIYLDHFQNFG